MTGDITLLLVGFGLGAITGAWWAYGRLRGIIASERRSREGWQHVARSLEASLEKARGWKQLQQTATKPGAGDDYPVERHHEAFWRKEHKAQ
jgi:hypothetical protein